MAEGEGAILAVQLLKSLLPVFTLNREEAVSVLFVIGPAYSIIAFGVSHMSLTGRFFLRFCVVCVIFSGRGRNTISIRLVVLFLFGVSLIPVFEIIIRTTDFAYSASTIWCTLVGMEKFWSGWLFDFASRTDTGWCSIRFSHGALRMRVG